MLISACLAFGARKFIIVAVYGNQWKLMCDVWHMLKGLSALPCTTVLKKMASHFADSFHHCKTTSHVSFIIDHRHLGGWMAGVDFAMRRFNTIAIQGRNTFARLYQRIRDAPVFTERFDELNILPLSLMHSRRIMRKLTVSSCGITSNFQVDANEMSYRI